MRRGASVALDRAWLIAVGVGLVIAYCALRPALRTAPPTSRRVLAAAGPFAAFVLVLSYANWRMFQHFMPGAGYYLLSEQQEVVVFAPHIGALGLLFDRVFGLLPHTPLYLLPRWDSCRCSVACGRPSLPRSRSAGSRISSSSPTSRTGGPTVHRVALPARAVPFLVVLLAAGIERLVTLGVARAVVPAPAGDSLPTHSSSLRLCGAPASALRARERHPSDQF